MPLWTKQMNPIRTLTAVLIACLAVGCGAGMSGMYVSTKGSPMDMSIDFQAGDKALVTAMGATVEGTYKVEGDKVTVYANGKNVVLTKDGDGVLNGGPLGLSFKRKD